MPMYKPFYSLMFNPFDKSIPVKHAFESEDYREMHNRLRFLTTTRGIGLFTAAPGHGKTFALRCFAGSLNPNLYQMSYTCLSTVSVIEFYRQLCLQLGLEPCGRKTAMFKAIQDRVRHFLKDKKKTLILAIDECQYLDNAILRELKLLMNEEYDSLDCFALLLVGLPHVNNVLEKPAHETLKQRIVVHYNFQGLSPSETSEYIYSRIEAAGGARSIIDEAAVQAAAGHCQGTPRLINALMTSALMLGAQTQKTTIDPDTILAASTNLALG